ncbi:ATP-dependent (S)-NAD(P)H-hydrate dehydratase [Contarinia nasturtii]|uniref:ATP-dependent (S)-NAD(P)H-hydrate dehydratase n=1 Tax=Contarinia nasturtii TaxID=265458 RepID=UPI0012D44479|nr:ATP-dependent (S)-NAD(P)H-hydrate dehydratase [Contarinia nasturtii]
MFISFVVRAVSIISFAKQSFSFANMSNSNLYLTKARQCVPLLTNDMHKGQAGRIGVVGGSFEYTGAPYFAGISALKLGADIVHIFCSHDAAIPIKSYSPELMVHPVLDDPNHSIDLIKPWLDRLHVLVIGPGLGRDPKVFATIRQLFSVCRELKKPLVIDADGLFLLSQDLSLIVNYPGAILTPNVVEFTRIFGDDGSDSQIKKIDALGPSVSILKKGFVDNIYSGVNKTSNVVNVEGGKARRCGGQGDILSGCTAVFYAWALRTMPGDSSEAAKVASVGASHFVKALNTITFEEKGRSMTASDMIDRIHTVFDEQFEHK